MSHSPVDAGFSGVDSGSEQDFHIPLTFFFVFIKLEEVCKSIKLHNWANEIKKSIKLCYSKVQRNGFAFIVKTQNPPPQISINCQRSH